MQVLLHYSDFIFRRYFVVREAEEDLKAAITAAFGWGIRQSDEKSHDRIAMGTLEYKFLESDSEVR